MVIDFSDARGVPKLASRSNCNGRAVSNENPYCCPTNFYLKDRTGCALCNGNIITVFHSQFCCPLDAYFNMTSLVCIKCEGLLDLHGRLCCPFGNYIYYSSSGAASCRTACPPKSIYKSFYCCESLGGSCSNTYEPTLCNPAIYIPGAC